MTWDKTKKKFSRKLGTNSTKLRGLVITDKVFFINDITECVFSYVTQWSTLYLINNHALGQKEKIHNK